MHLKCFYTKICGSLLFTLATLVSLSAQQYKENSAGQAIILYPDGTWRNFDQNNSEDLALRSSKLDTSEDRKESKNSVEVANLSQQVVEQLEKALAAENKATADYEEKTEQYFLATTQLKEAKTAKADKKEIKALQNICEEAERQTKSAKKTAQTATELRKKLDRLLSAKPKMQQKELAKLALLPQKKEVKRAEATAPAVVQNAATPDIDAKKKEKIKKTAPNNSTETVPIKIYPIVFEGMDEFNGKKRIDVEKAPFFTHTDEALKNYMKDKGRAYIVGEANVSRMGGINYLNVYFNIASDNTQRQFGLLEKGSSLQVKLLNGEKIRLLNNRTDSGTSDPLRGTTTYKGQYQIDDVDEKVLSKTLVDKIVVVWTTGYDEYEVTETDFLMNQFKSLKNGKKY